MKWMLFAACAAVMAALCLPGEAAPPGVSAAAAAGQDAITFEQYREWRLNFIERRRGELAAQLSAADLPADRKARLERTKAYYDGLAGLPEADRDRRFRERFDRMDANHDGIVDPAERAAWHDKQRALYRRDRPPKQEATAQAAR